MKFLHLSDLHLGKRLHGYSLLDDQRHFLFEIALPEARKAGANVILVSGDIYDVAVPNAETTRLLNDFLVEASRRNYEVIIIPGNHDSAERLHYGSSFMKEAGIHLITDLEEARTPVKIDGVNFYGIPFSRGVDFLSVLEEPKETLAERFGQYLDTLPLNEEEPNVLLLHQALSTSAESLSLSGSETTFIGTSQILSPHLFERFDYVALGHIHKSYAPSSNSFYAGSPLKYHVDEAKDKKHLVFVEIEGKKVSKELVPFAPLRDLVVEEGSFKELMEKRNERDYVAVILTDEALEKNAKDCLQKTAFPYLLSVKTKAQQKALREIADFDEKQMGLEESFAEFYEKIMGEPLTEHQREFALAAQEYAKEEGKRE